MIKYWIFLIFNIAILSSCAVKTVEKPVYIEKPIYIKPNIPPIPERPVLEQVEFYKIGENYCIDKNNAKKLLINFYKLDNYARQLEIIIDDIKQEVQNAGQNKNN